MRVAVIGAGIVGVATAFELARDGHQVTVFERRGSVAEESSFANAGLLCSADTDPWAAPGLPARLLRQLVSRHAPITLARPLARGELAWLWRCWRAGSAEHATLNLGRLQRLAQYSRARLQALAVELESDHEQAQGCLVLLRGQRELALARTRLAMLQDLGLDAALVDAAAARLIEPGLNPGLALAGALHLPQDGVGNCRQFAHLLRAQAQRLGARFQFQRVVVGLSAGPQPVLRHQDANPGAAATEEAFDAVVVCAAMGSAALLAPLGLRLPLAAVHGYTITAPLHHLDQQHLAGPHSAVVDARHQVSISRLGERVRVAGRFELGGRPHAPRPSAVATLYKLLDDCFPGCAQMSKLQQWKGARPTLPDGLPLVGASAAGGVWLNLGHGGSGWALACGSARLLADRVAGREPEIDAQGLDLSRLAAH